MYACATAAPICIAAYDSPWRKGRVASRTISWGIPCLLAPERIAARRVLQVNTLRLAELSGDKDCLCLTRSLCERRAVPGHCTRATLCLIHKRRGHLRPGSPLVLAGADGARERDNWLVGKGIKLAEKETAATRLGISGEGLKNG